MATELLDLFKTGLVTTRQGSFYNTASDELKMLISQHTQGLISDRNLYTALAFTSITDANKLMIVRGLLATGKARDPEQDDLEWNIIVEILKRIKITAVLRFFVNDVANNNQKTGTKRLANSRAKRLGLHLWQTANTFQCVKYASKFKKIIVHGHIPFTVGDLQKQELHRWITGKIKKAEDVTYCQVLKTYLLASEGNVEALKALPLDQAQGIATELKIDLTDFRVNIANESSVTSSGEKMRLQSQTSGETDIDWRQYDLLQLIRYGRDHKDQWSEIFPIIKNKAELLSSSLRLPEGVALIVDNSLSMYGSGDRKGYPLAFAEAVMRIFLGNETPVNVWLSHSVDYLSEPLMAQGASDLRTPVAQAISAGCKHIVLISDGYENASEGSINQISKLKAVKQAGIKFHHINPVGAAETGGLRALGESIQPLSISGLDQISSAGMLKHFESSIAAFHDFLRDVFSALEQGRFAEAAAIAKFENQPVKLLGEF